MSILEGDTPDRVKMIMAAFSAFSSISASVTSSQREDVRGVAILLYSGMQHRYCYWIYILMCFLDLLKDESSEIDLVGPTLPALKGILDLPTESLTQAQEGYGRLVHGLLSACLLNIDAMRCVANV